MTTEKHTILIVDDHPVFRKGLLHLLEKKKDLCVVGEASDGLTAFEMVCTKKPDIVIMDINMPNLNGVEATRQILSKFPDTRVVALSVHSGRQYVRSMFEAGASGYILKEKIPEEMIDGIRNVIAGDIYLDRSISNVLISDYKTLISSFGQEPETAPRSILSTKLYPPSIVPQIIPRPRLIEILEQGAGNAITLVAAPAGYGKSILVSQWLSVSKLQGTWVSLDENDNDIKLFLEYMMAAMQRLFPLNEWYTASLLNAARLPVAQVISRYFLNDLDKIDSRFILVLDDYHHIRNPEIHDFIEALLMHPSPVMHLALLTRRDPPLALVSLRNRGMLTEIASRQIAFTAVESKSFLERYLHVEISEETARILQEKMDGWVTGLRLAALSIGKKIDPERLLSGMAGTTKLIREYLIEEVLSRVPSTVRALALKTAFLDRFCASLCDALFMKDLKEDPAEPDLQGQEFIDWLNKNNMFLIPLGVDGNWVRYHQVFQQLLQDRAILKWSPEEIAGIHLQAGAWLAENGFIDEAIFHMLTAGDGISAAVIIEDNRRNILDAGQWQTLEKWLDRLPDEVQQKRPELLICQAWVFLMEMRIAEIRPIIKYVESVLKKETMNSDLVLELDFFRGLICYFDGNGEPCTRWFKNIIELPPESLFATFRAEAEIWFGMSLHKEGRKDEAVIMFRNKIQERGLQETRFKLLLNSGLCNIYLLDGEFPAALYEANQMQRISRTSRVDVSDPEVMYIQGNASLQMFDLDAAQHHLGKAMEKRYLGDHRQMVDAMAGLAITFSFMGAFDKARETIGVAEDFARWTNISFHHEVVESCKARIALIQGDLDSASFWRKSTGNMNGTPTMLFFLQNPAVTECRVLIALGSKTEISDAVSKLKKLQQNAGIWHNNCLMMETVTLLSMAVHRQGRLSDSLGLLEKALVMAQPREWLRPFIEAGPPMIDLLELLKSRKTAVAFIDKVLTAVGNIKEFSENGKDKAEGVIPGESGLLQSPASWTLTEPLTNRELDVLELLAQRFQNKEIAEKLFISGETVKGHLKNIFQKLAASNRRDAVEKAKRLHIV